MWYGMISLVAGIIATIMFLIREFDGDFLSIFFALTVGFSVAVAWPLLLLAGLIWLICYPFAYGFDLKKSN